MSRIKKKFSHTQGNWICCFSFILFPWKNHNLFNAISKEKKERNVFAVIQFDHSGTHTSNNNNINIMWKKIENTLFICIQTYTTAPSVQYLFAWQWITIQLCSIRFIGFSSLFLWNHYFIIGNSNVLLCFFFQLNFVTRDKCFPYYFNAWQPLIYMLFYFKHIFIFFLFYIFFTQTNDIHYFLNRNEKSFFFRWFYV